MPLVSAISTTKAAQNGFLIRNKISLEKARKIDTVLFDKTGTLTKGEYGVTNIISIKTENEDYVLLLAASVDNESEHSISRALVKKAKDKKLKLFEVKNFQRLAGIGVKGKIKENTILVGGERILKEIKTDLPNNIKSEIKKLAKQGKTIIYIIENKKIIGVIALSDIIREESRDAIKKLNDMGFKTAMVTGDSEEVARFVSQELGIDKYFARIMPDEKLNIVKELQKENKKIAFVGDGINDAPALTQADLGIAIGSGTNVAIESAGIILVKNDPRDIVKIIKLSQLTYSKMIQNLFWASGYNIVAIPLAGGILYSQGILLQPALAAIFMSVSTVIVAFNAILLKNRAL
ncbi:MAG: HAD-IC family P-type ATPase [Patescibacteria group bacterium]